MSVQEMIETGKELLDKMQFFGGQRAGRELWADKPYEVQERDIEAFNRDIDTLRDIIRQLEAKAPKWISVEDRLPEDDDSNYIVWNGIYINIAIYWGDGRWWPAGGYIVNDITHWMPLPKPPKER